MAKMTKAEFNPLLSVIVDELLAELKKIKNKIAYNEEALKHTYESEKQAKISKEKDELLSDRLYILSQIKVLTMILKYPLYLSISKLDESKKDDIINGMISKYEAALSEKRTRLNALENTEYEVGELPDDFADWSKAEREKYYLESESKKETHKKSVDSEIGSCKTAIADLESKITDLKTPIGKKKYFDEQFEALVGISTFEESFRLEEFMNLFRSIDVLPSNISHELARQLFKNPEVAKELISKYRDLYFNTVVHKGSFLGNMTSGILSTGIFGDDISSDEIYNEKDALGIRLERLCGIDYKETRGFAEIEALKDNRNVEFEMQRRKDLALSSLLAARRKAADYKMSSPTSIDIVKYLKQDGDTVGSLNSLFTEFSAMLQKLSTDDMDPELLKKLTSGLFKDQEGRECTHLTVNDIKTQMEAFQSEYAAEGKKKAFEHAYKATDRANAVADRAWKLQEILNKGFYELNARMRSLILYPYTEELPISKAYKRLQNGIYSPTSVVLNLSDKEFEKYVAEIAEEFNRVSRVFSSNVSRAYESGKKVMEEEIIPVEDEIFDIIKPVLGADNKEQVIELGKTTLKGLFGDIIENSITKEKHEENRRMQKPISSLELDLEFARRREALLNYMQRDDGFGSSARSYMSADEGQIEVTPENELKIR